MSLTVANAERVTNKTLADVLMPPPKVDYVKWAEENIVFSKRESAFEGPYNRDRFGYFDGPLFALGPDDPCRIVTLRGSAQIGKTVVGNVFAGGTMDMAPCDFMFIHPTEDNASRWSKMKLMPFIRGTPRLRAIFPLQSREGGNSVLYKERTDGAGALLISGSNSEASTSMVSIEKQVQDDLSKWEGDEGQADSRSNSREFAKILKSSTPLIEPGCKITRNYNDGSQERFYVPCPHCDAMQTLEWENMLANLDEEHPERAHFTCIECGTVIEQHHRPEMRRRGEWRADNPKMLRFHRSFYIWSAYSDLMSWERIARAWFKAKGDPKAEQTFLNDVVGRAYKATGVAPPWEGLRDRAAESKRRVGQIPAGYMVLTCGVDCQVDRVEWQVVARGKGLRRAIIAYGVIPHHISSLEAHKQLDALLLQGFENAYGRKLTIDMLAIDGNAWTEDVWGWSKKHPASRVIMVRGVASEAAPLLIRVKKEVSKSGKKLPYSRRFYNFAASVMKWTVYRDLEKVDPLERGYIDLPDGLPEAYFQQVTSETRKEVRNRFGGKEYRWIEDPNVRNEALDTLNQAEAAWVRIAGATRELMDARWDAYAAEREVPLLEVQLDLEDVLPGSPPAGKLFPNGTVKTAETPPQGRGQASPGSRYRRRSMRTSS